MAVMYHVRIMTGASDFRALPLWRCLFDALDVNIVVHQNIASLARMAVHYCKTIVKVILFNT